MKFERRIDKIKILMDMLKIMSENDPQLKKLYKDKLNEVYNQ